MNPWLWYWSPVIHFPGSGDVVQDIDPVTSWFPRVIPPEAGDAVIEKKAIATVATYGKQLGLITEVLLDVLAQSKALPDSHSSLKELRGIQKAIEDLKTEEYTLRADDLLAQVERILSREGKESEAFAEKLREKLGEKKDGEG